MAEKKTEDQADDFATSMKGMNRRLELAQAEAREAQAEVEAKTMILNKGRGQLKKKEMELEILMQKVRTVNEKLFKYDEEYQKKEEIRLGLMKDIAHVKQEHCEVEHQMNTVRESAAESEEMQSEYKNSVKIAEKDLDDEFELEYERIKKEVEDLQDIRQKLMEGDQMMKLVESGQAIQTVFDQTNAIQRAVEEKEQMVVELEENLLQKEEMVTRLQEQLANNEQQQSELRSLKQKLEDLKKEEQELTQRQNAIEPPSVLPKVELREFQNSDYELITVEEEITESDDECAAMAENFEQ